MYEEAQCDERARDNPPWQWAMRGCVGVVALLQFDDEDVWAEWLEQEG